MRHQEATINRLIRTQTGRSRNKIAKEDSGDGTSTPSGAGGTADAGGAGSGSSTAKAEESATANDADVAVQDVQDGMISGRRKRARMQPVHEGMIRWVSSVVWDKGSESRNGDGGEIGNGNGNGNGAEDVGKEGLIGSVGIRLGVPLSLVNVVDFVRR